MGATSSGVEGTEGLDHAGVVVADLDAAVDFFIRWFGARVMFRLDRVADPSGEAPARLGAPRDASFALAMLALGTGRLELLQWWRSGPPPPAALPHAVGAAHVAVRVTDVPATLARLRTATGVEVLSEPVTFDAGPTPGLTNAFLHTDWGVLIELVHWGSSDPDEVVSSRPR